MSVISVRGQIAESRGWCGPRAAPAGYRGHVVGHVGNGTPGGSCDTRRGIRRERAARRRTGAESERARETLDSHGQSPLCHRGNSFGRSLARTFVRSLARAAVSAGLPFDRVGSSSSSSSPRGNARLNTVVGHQVESADHSARARETRESASVSPPIADRGSSVYAGIRAERYREVS